MGKGGVLMSELTLKKARLSADMTTLTEEAKAFVEQIEGFTLEQFVENKMGQELANLEVNYATRLTGLEQKDNQLAAQLAQIIQLSE